MSLSQKSCVIASTARQSIGLDCRTALAMTGMEKQLFGNAWPVGRRTVRWLKSAEARIFAQGQAQTTATPVGT